MDRTYAEETLLRFLSYPLSEPTGVMAELASLPRAVYDLDTPGERYVYVPGTRADRVLLVAHADTVWDGDADAVQSVYVAGGVVRGRNAACGIGADDRAGCAILWLLRESGHSLLVLDGEEYGSLAARHLRDAHPALFDELNGHAYAVELDRREDKNYKTYHLPVSRAFLSFIESSTGYRSAGNRSSTDITVLCRDICGVNLSVGYYDEHTEEERLVLSEWYRTLSLLEEMLKGPQKRYLLENR